MEESVRELLHTYGYRNVRQEVEKQCREIYEELRVLYGTVQVQHAQSTIPAPLLQVPEFQESNVKVVKKLSQPPVEVHKAETESESEEETVNALVTVSETAASTYKQKTAEEKKQEKADHRRAVQKKRQELLGKGVNPEDLLTKENLEKWLNAGLSYQRIAREQTGCHENDISAVAKLHGLKSKIASYVFMRHGQS